MIFLWLLLGFWILISFAVLYLVVSELWRVVFFGGVPSLSSTWAIVDRVLAERVLPTKGLILDLGCSRGWTLRRFHKAGIAGPLVGYERAFSPWIVGAFWSWITMMPIKIVKDDYERAPIEEAYGIYLFLLPKAMTELAKILAKRAKPETVIVCAEFPLPDWRPVSIFEARGVTSRRSKIFVYKPVDSLSKSC
ncbi:MAG: hypothetical protein ABIB04_02725 [Patescibacteria group bacterium]